MSFADHERDETVLKFIGLTDRFRGARSDRDLVVLVNDISNAGYVTMSLRCSICPHPKLDLINVSLLRDGTRSTVREFQISRSALDRHKRHLKDSVEFQAGPTPAEPLSNAQGDPVLSQLEVMIRHSENTISQAVAAKDFRIVTRAMREQRAQLELKNKIVSERRNHRLVAGRADQKSPAIEASAIDDPYEQLAIVALRVRIKLASEELGEPAFIAEPSNLKYLKEKNAALSARLEQRKLRSLSQGLATIHA